MLQYCTFRQFSSDGHGVINQTLSQDDNLNSTRAHASRQVSSMVCVPAPSMRFRVHLFPASVYLNLLLVSSPACSLLAWIYSNMQAEIEKKINDINLIYFTGSTHRRVYSTFSSNNSFISWSYVNIFETLQYWPHSTGPQISLKTGELLLH